MTGPLSDDERGQLFTAATMAAAVPAAIGAAIIPVAVAAEMGLNAVSLAAAALLILGTFGAGFFVALGHAVLLGLPLYRLLRARGPVKWPAAALAGFAIGALPVQLLGDVDEARLEAALIFGLLGVSGALAFRWALDRAP